MSDQTLTTEVSRSRARRAPRQIHGLVVAWSDGLARAGETLPLSRRDPITVGRESPSFTGGPLGDRRMSRAHATFAYQRRRWTVTDAGSKNGCLVNGDPVANAPIEAGDVIRLGDTLLVFCELAAEAVDPDGELVGVGLTMQRARESLALAAETPHSVLVCGESGTGKELAARTIHRLSGRRGKLLAVNCASLRGELLESELFGHVRGAFTGADRPREGLFRKADGGTVFLDEVGELEAGTQARLLRVLQERTVRPVGGSVEIAVDARVIAATNRDLEAAVTQGGFRADLYARLAQWCVTMPALRERREDVGCLARAVLAREAPTRDLSLELMEQLLQEQWALNVRGLVNLLTTARIAQPGSQPLEMGPRVEAALGSQRRLATSPAPGPTESGGGWTPPTRDALELVLSRHKGRVAAVARELGASRQQVYRLLERLGLSPEEYR